MSVSSKESVPLHASSHAATSLHVLLDVGTLGVLSDGQLLERFLGVNAWWPRPHSRFSSSGTDRWF